VLNEVIEIKYGPSDSIRVGGFGDFHAGAVLSDEETIRRFVGRYAGAKNVFLLSTGDLVDAIPLYDKRYDPRAVDPRFSLKTQKNKDRSAGVIDLVEAYIVDLLEPLTGQILLGCEGNHEEEYFKSTGFSTSIHHKLSKALRFTPAGYDGAFIRFRFSPRRSVGKTFFVDYHVTHGTRGKDGIIKDAAKLECDVLMHGHTHLLSTRSVTRLLAGDEKYKFTKIHTLQCGSALKSYSHDSWSAYSAKRRYEPLDQGWGMTEIIPSQWPHHIKSWTES